MHNGGVGLDKLNAGIGGNHAVKPAYNAVGYAVHKFKTARVAHGYNILTHLQL